MKFFLKIFLLLIFFQSSSYSLNFYKYPQKNLGGDFCLELYENLNEPNFPYSREDPIIVKADLLVEDIHSINGKDLDFIIFYFMGSLERRKSSKYFSRLIPLKVSLYIYVIFSDPSNWRN